MPIVSSFSGIAARGYGISAGTSTVITGGTLFEDSTYYYRLFTTSGSLTVTGQAITGDVLVVGGGQAGGLSDRVSSPFVGASASGGGGAGAIQWVTNRSITVGTQTITVGTGGNPAEGAGQGGSSSALGVIAYGGGTSATPPVASGQGGIAFYQAPSTYVGGSGETYGGTGYCTTSTDMAGGGGGGDYLYGSSGANATASAGGAGGDGTLNFSSILAAVGGIGQNISGSYWIGGGGGGARAAGNSGAGGKGGGGAASSTAGGVGSNGLANTGGGGGAGCTPSSNGSAIGGSGGSGVVVIRYLKSAIG